MTTPRNGRRAAKAAQLPSRGGASRFALPSAVLLSTLAVVAAPTPATAQAESPAPAAASAEGAGSIAGRVVDAASGKYLEGAEVSVRGTSLKTTASRDGTFTLKGVPAGDQVVAVNYMGMEASQSSVAVLSGESSVIMVKLNPEVIRLEDFTVTGTREGMAQAVVLQKVSVQTKLVAAADQFGPISEGNVGEYLKFLPGVSIDYNVNDARGVSLRGLSTTFTIVAVDGTPMAASSSVDATRRFEFEQIAMNNVETTELFKTVTPDIPASATGGFVNFVTKSAFDHDEQQRISYDLSFIGPSTNYKLFSKTGGVWGNKKEYTVRPNLELNISRKINDKIGININYRYSDKYDDAPRLINNWTLSGTTPTLTYVDIADEQKLTHRESLAGKLDFRISDKTKFFVAGSWNNYDLLFTQRYLRVNLGSNSTLDGDTVTSGTAGTRNVQNNILQRRKHGDTYHYNATLEHTFGDDSVLRITPYWSRADGYYDDTAGGYISGTATYTYSASSAQFNQIKLSGIHDLTAAPTIQLLSGSTAVPTSFIRDLGNYTYSNSATGTAFQSRPWHARDIKSGINGNYIKELFQDSKMPVKLDIGAAYDDSYRSIYTPALRGAVSAITGSALESLADDYYDSDVAFGFGSLEAIDPYKLWETYSGTTMVVNNFNKYKFHEENTAAYARADVKVTPDLLLVGGVRWEERSIEAQTTRFASNRTSAGETNLKYDSFFPSLTVKYTPVKQLVIRGGASRTVGHPDYGTLTTFWSEESTDGAGDATITASDPDLKPYYATNFDIGADYYIGNTGVFGVALFHKKLENFIASRGMSSAELVAITTELGLESDDFTSGSVFANGASATSKGFEISYVQNLSFLPKPFNGFDIQANYSYTDVSSSDLATQYSARSAVSPQTFNLIVGYRVGKWKFAVTNNWVDESQYGGFVNTPSVVGSGDNRMVRWKDDRWQTDVKVEYSFNKYLSAYAMVRNIFDTGRDEFLQGYIEEKQNIRLPMRYGSFGDPYFTFGIRGTF